MQLGKAALLQHRTAVAQGDETAIVIQHRIGILLLVPNINAGVVSVDRKPRRAAGKTGIDGIIPLHGGTGVIPALFFYHLPAQGTGQVQLLAQVPDVEGLHIPNLLHTGIIKVGHADFLPLK